MGSNGSGSPVDRAMLLGHRMIADSDARLPEQRWQCGDCRAILVVRNGKAYGNALTKECG